MRPVLNIESLVRSVSSHCIALDVKLSCLIDLTLANRQVPVDFLVREVNFLNFESGFQGQEVYLSSSQTEDVFVSKRKSSLMNNDCSQWTIWQRNSIFVSMTVCVYWHNLPNKSAWKESLKDWIQDISRNNKVCVCFLNKLQCTV